jgi:hypothetical protein
VLNEDITTFTCCCNAAGSFIPPFLVFARKRMIKRRVDGAPTECQASRTENRCISGETFLQWLQFFVEQVRPTATRKVLLFLANRAYNKYIETLDYATENNVLFLSFASHTAHKAMF